MDFKQRLKELRVERRISQKVLASKLNYGSTAIANYESGRNEPSIRDLITISQTLNVSIDYLLGITDVQNPYMKDESFEQFREIRRLFALLTPENAAELIHYANYRVKLQDENIKQRKLKSVKYQTPLDNPITELKAAEEPVEYQTKNTKKAKNRRKTSEN